MGSYLNRGYEMKSKLFLLCGESVSLFIFFSFPLTAHMSTSVVAQCFNTPYLVSYRGGELCLKKEMRLLV